MTNARSPNQPSIDPGKFPAIRTYGLTKSYGERRGVFDLDLEVAQGEISGFSDPTAPARR